MKLGSWVIIFVVSLLFTITYWARVQSVPRSSNPVLPVSTPGPTGEAEPDLRQIKKLDPFRTKNVNIKPQAFSCVNPGPISLPFRLVSTSVLADRTKSVAILTSPQTGSLEIREGQKITTELEVYQINRRQVLFRNLSLNTCELVNLAESIPD